MTLRGALHQLGKTLRELYLPDRIEAFPPLEAGDALPNDGLTVLERMILEALLQQGTCSIFDLLASLQLASPQDPGRMWALTFQDLSVALQTLQCHHFIERSHDTRTFRLVGVSHELRSTIRSVSPLSRATLLAL